MQQITSDHVSILPGSVTSDFPFVVLEIHLSLDSPSSAYKGVDGFFANDFVAYFTAHDSKAYMQCIEIETGATTWGALINFSGTSLSPKDPIQPPKTQWDLYFALNWCVFFQTEAIRQKLNDTCVNVCNAADQTNLVDLLKQYRNFDTRFEDRFFVSSIFVCENRNCCPPNDICHWEQQPYMLDAKNDEAVKRIKKTQAQLAAASSGEGNKEGEYLEIVEALKDENRRLQKRLDTIEDSGGNKSSFLGQIVESETDSESSPQTLQDMLDLYPHDD